MFMWQNRAKNRELQKEKLTVDLLFSSFSLLSSRVDVIERKKKVAVIEIVFRRLRH